MTWSRRLLTRKARHHHLRGTTYKIKHLRRDPRVSMLIFGEQYSGSKFVQIHGTAELIELPKAMDILIYWYKQVPASTKTGRL